jgi:hypothetical protein
MIRNSLGFINFALDSAEREVSQNIRNNDGQKLPGSWSSVANFRRLSGLVVDNRSYVVCLLMKAETNPRDF